MGKFGIGARVKDYEGDAGTIVDKRKGERLVDYDSGLGKVWRPKSSLTLLPANDNAGGWVPKVGERVRYTCKSENWSDRFMIGALGTVSDASVKNSIVVDWDQKTIGGYSTGGGKYPENLEPVVDAAPIAQPEVAVAEAIATTTKFNFKVGDEALTRNGTKVTINSVDNTPRYPFVHDCGDGSYHGCTAEGKSCIDADEWDIIAGFEPAAPPAKLKVGDRIDYSDFPNCWNGTVITEVRTESDGRLLYIGNSPDGSQGGFYAHQIRLSAPTPLNSTVTITATGRLSAINENGHYQVTFPGLAPGQNSFALPAKYVSAA